MYADRKRKKKRKKITVRPLLLANMSAAISNIWVPLIFSTILRGKYPFKWFHGRLYRIIDFYLNLEAKNKFKSINMLFEGIENEEEAYSYLQDYDLPINDKFKAVTKFLQFRREVEKIIQTENRFSAYENFYHACKELINPEKHDDDSF